MELTEETTACIDNKVFIDMKKKTFDTINHDIWLQQLERYGIRGVVLDWVKRYMGDRQKFVRLSDYISTRLAVLWQGGFI